MLITLGIIGVVAAITMPALMSNINERVNSERQANIVYKFNQAMEHMRATGKLTAYDSTESFVNELQKHMKIAKVCDKDHIAECWTTNKVKTGLGEELLIKDVKTGDNLMLNTGTNNVGLILADGASIILNFDNSFKGMDIGDAITSSPIGLPNGNGKSKVYMQYTTNLMSPLTFVMDVNGKKGPNSETIDGKYHDIRSFGGARLSSACAGDYYNGTCVYYVGSAYNSIDCSNINNPQYNYCLPHSSGRSDDFWAGAKAKCGSMNMDLPTVEQLQNIYREKNHYSSIASSSDIFITSEEDPGNITYYALSVYFGEDGNMHGHHKYSANSYSIIVRNVLCIKK